MAVAAGAMTKEQLISQMDEAFSKMGDMTDTFLTEIAVNYVSAEYQAQGIDLNQVRNAYLFAVGGKMLLCALASAVLAVICGYLSARTASGFSYTLRKKLFDHVAMLEHIQVNGACVQPQHERLRAAGADLHGQQRRHSRAVFPDEAVRKNEVRAGHIIVIEGIALHVNIPPACSQLV